MYFCKYRDIFGKPNSGVHSIRLFNIAVVDLILTLLFAYVISKYTNISFISISVVLLIVSVYTHKLFCVDTTLTKFFTLSKSIKKERS